MITVQLKPAHRSGTMFTLPAERPDVPLTAQGLTLIELMIVLALVGVLLGIAVPVFRDLSVTANFNRSSETLAKALGLARNEAISRGQMVSACALNPNTPTLCSTAQNNWTDGWLVFVDPEADGLFTPDQLIRTFPRVNLEVEQTLPNPNTFLVFNPIGRSTPATFTLNDDTVHLGNVDLGVTGQVTTRKN